MAVFLPTSLRTKSPPRSSSPRPEPNNPGSVRPPAAGRGRSETWNGASSGQGRLAPLAGCTMFSLSPGRRQASALKKPAPASFSHLPLKVASTRVSRRRQRQQFLDLHFLHREYLFQQPGDELAAVLCCVVVAVEDPAHRHHQRPGGAAASSCTAPVTSTPFASSPLPGVFRSLAVEIPGVTLPGSGRERTRAARGRGRGRRACGPVVDLEPELAQLQRCGNIGGERGGRRRRRAARPGSRLRLNMARNSRAFSRRVP